MKKYILMLIILQAVYVGAWAQEKVKGRVVDAQLNEAIPGAVIKIPEKNNTIITDAKGEFELNLAAGKYKAIIQSLGYVNKEVEVSVPMLGELVISLNYSNNNLNEVQIIGYGTTTKRLNTGSISTLKASEIESQPVSNVLSALSGRLPGVVIQTTNGLPGGNINVQIRGKGSLSAGTNPLFIIDGVPFDISPPNAFNHTMANSNVGGTLNPLNTLNPDDVESITVLKDADATSIYGSRGSNGVILITTKSSLKNGTNLSVGYNKGFSSAAHLPSLLNLDQYLEMRKEAFRNSGLVPSNGPTESTYAPDLTLWDQNDNKNWIDLIYGNEATYNNINFSLNTKSDYDGFVISGNFHNEETILSNKDFFERFSVKSNYNYHRNKFKISSVIQISKQNSEYSNLSTSTSYLLPPNFPIYTDNSSYYNWVGGMNPYAEQHAKSKSNTANLIANLNLEQDISKNIVAKISFGFNQTFYKQAIISPLISLRPNSINNTRHSNNRINNLIIEPQISYQKKKNEHAINLLIGSSLQERQSTAEFIQMSNFNVEALMEDYGAGAIVDAKTSSYTTYRFAGLFSRLGYVYSNKYIFNATVRRDGSSRFGPDMRFGNFFSLGGAWIWTDYNFIKKVFPFISFGKLRMSYGTTGNDQIGDGQYLTTYSSTGVNLYQGLSVLRPNRINNSNFHWETTTKKDLALEVGLFKDNLFLDANLYSNRTSDQLVNYPLPQLTGFSSHQANIPAVVENRGFEFSGLLNLFSNRKVKASFNFNINWVKNQLISFENLENSSYANTYQIGKDITSARGFIWLGLDPNTGLSKYADINGEDKLPIYQFHNLGSRNPIFYGGVGSSWSYKQLSLSFFGQYSKQNGFGYAPSALPGMGMMNHFKASLDRWSENKKDAKYPIAKLNTYDINYKNSTANFFDTSYLRLKSVELSYNFKVDFLNKLNIKNLRISLQGQNLITIWNNKLPLFDPESGNLVDGLSRNMPPLKSLVFNTQINF